MLSDPPFREPSLTCAMQDLSTILAAAPPTLLIAAAFAAGLVRGYSGFGSAMVFMPVAGALIGPVQALAVLFLIDAFFQLLMVRTVIGQARWTEIRPILMGYCLGVPLGVHLLTAADPALLRWATSLTILAGLALIVSGFRWSGPASTPASVGTGLFSGVVSGSTSLGGLILSLFWLSGEGRNAEIRASVTMFFVLASIVSGTLLAMAGVFTGDALRLGLWCAAPYAVGILSGAALFARAAPGLFRPAMFSLIAMSALAGLPVFDAALR